MTDRTIPVFFSVDDNYLPFLAVAIRSLIDNLSPDAHCDIHVLNTGLQSSKFRIIRAMETDRVRIRSVDVTHRIRPLTERLLLRDYYTPSIYYRLFIPSLFPQYRKAIYLDADIVVNGDVSRLFEAPIGNRLVAAVSDDVIASNRNFRLYAEEAVGVSHRHYFNSGVLLMNLDQLRRQNVEEKLIALMNRHHFETVCPDQDYLNVLCRGQVLYLDKGWNKMSIDRRYDGTPMIVHYNMFYKPWQYRHICYRELFWQYAERTPFYAEILSVYRSFGLKARIDHLLAHRRLHQSVRRIRALPDNFRRVLDGSKLSALVREEKTHGA